MLASAGCATTPSAMRLQRPLEGRIWHVEEQRFIDAEELAARAADARYVLLGEAHDHPVHHQHQAEVLQRLVNRGLSPAVAWEMIPLSYQPILDDFSGSPKQLAEAVHWSARGWPDFAMYAPIAHIALQVGLPLVAANIDGKPPTSPPEITLPQHLEEDLRQKLVDAHCGHMSDPTTLQTLSHAQQHRDTVMANQLMRAHEQHTQVVLIAGLEHIRLDRGAPYFLRHRGVAPEQILSISMVEVSPELTDPRDYRAASSHDGHVFDVLWFTPRLVRKDPCAVFRQ